MPLGTTQTLCGVVEVNCEKPARIVDCLVRSEVDNSPNVMLCLKSFLMC